MRVVGGDLRGRRLRSPPGTLARPTTDRVREAVFNVLWSLGALDGAVVADLYAGSGALGIEALSRGADVAHFVEQDRRAADVIEANIDDLGLRERATVHVGAVESVLDRLPDDLDLVLADPPYAFDRWATLLGELAPKLAADATVVIESDREPELPPGWRVVRSKAYGGTVVVVARAG